ncbi:MAG: LysR family transcriptional regulator [Gammaproteobacteria bacterium]|nr:LysR family transcriptional regulator [Gammaproteobacteria bacterium]
MDLGLLKAFVEVNRLRHFGRAANNLFISQSAISARIRQLEDEVGARLFTRDRNNIELTPAGKKFLIYADNIINSWNRARLELAVPEGNSTFLSIAALPSIWEIVIDDWLVWLYNSNNNIALQTDIMRQDSLLRSLLDGALDLGFVFDPPKTPQILALELTPVPLILVSSKPNDRAETAVKSDYIFVDWGTSFQMMHASQYPELPPPKLRASVGRIALNFLNECGGAAYLPKAMVSEQLGLTLFQVEDATIINKEAYAVYSAASHKKESIENALKWFE